MSREFWEHFPHGADVGIRGGGPTRERAFAQAALALTAVIAGPETIAAKTTVKISCKAPDDALLLADWLNAIIYEMAVRNMLFGAFDVTIRNSQLTAEAHGEMIDLQRHHPAVEVKGATYTNLDVRQEKNGTWIAQCVVDV